MVRSQAMRCFDPNRKAWNPGRRHAWRVYGRIASPAASEVCVMFSAGRRLDRERVDGEISDSFRGQRGGGGKVSDSFSFGNQCFLACKTVGGGPAEVLGSLSCPAPAMARSPSLRRLSVWAQPRDSLFPSRIRQFERPMPSAVSSKPVSLSQPLL